MTSVYTFEIWIEASHPDERRGWLLARGSHYAADAARLPNAARLAWAGEGTIAEAKRRFDELLGLDSDDGPGDALGLAAT